jgi:hypothetical protein
MATQFAFGKIVTDGLVLLWDIADKSSYPGSGTTVYDLSGNGNHGTLVNGVGYSITSTGPVLTFDGIDDYLQSASPNLLTANYTVIGATRYSGATRGRMINGTGNNWLLGHWSNSTQKYYAQGWITNSSSNENSDTNWRIYTGNGSVSGDLYSFYVNNTLIAGPSIEGSQGPSGITIGKIGYVSSEYSTGEFSFILAYNRILTTDEMTQIYNAKKSRFNL